MKKITPKILQNICYSIYGRLILFAVFVALGNTASYAQTTYYSKAAATDFNSLSSWGTGTDGAGAAPAAISNADNFIIANGSSMTLSGNATVRQLTINSGTLTVSANALTVSKAGVFDTSFTVNTGGTLNFSGGTITVNGNVLFANGSNFNQSGGTMSVDGNNGGVVAGSVAAGTPLFAIGSIATSYASGTVSLTGGTIVIVDPSINSGDNDYAFVTNLSSNANNITASTNHTLQIGNGVSTDAGGSASYGYKIYFWYGTGGFKAGNYIVNAPAGTNRHVLQVYKSIVGGNLTITQGELRYAETSPYNVAGNISVAAGAIFTNTGTLALSDGNYTSSTTITNSASLNSQTISGAGTFRNLAALPTANFTSITIQNNSSAGVVFAGTSNIASQPANSVSASGTLTFISGSAGTSGGASFILGTSASSTGTLAYTSGGFKSGTTFGRWFSATGTGTSIASGTDNTAVGGRYPFVNAINLDRSASIERNTPTGAGGILAVTYTAGTGITTITATDGAATVDRRGNDTWAVSVLNGTPTSATSFELQLLAPGAFAAPLTTASTRIIQGTTFVGTHQAGTTTPGGQRALTAAELTSGAFSLAAASSDIPYTSVTSGDWSSPSTWSTGVVPVCTDVVNIGAGTVVTVNGAGAVSKNITVLQGGTLVVATGDLTVGCTFNNNTLTNRGTLTVSGGALNINGNISNASSSIFNQSGGTIRIDGNAAGVTTNSVAAATPLFYTASTNINLTGGTLLFVDPHAGTTTTSYTFSYDNATGSSLASPALNSSSAHITQLGDGVSTDAGGHANGFYINNWVSSAYISFGSVAINGGSSTNRGVLSQYQFTVNGNVTVNANSTLTVGVIIIGGDLTVNATGTLINTGSPAGIVTGRTTSSSSSSLTFGPTAVAQTFTNTGTIANAATASTANFSSLTINNTSTAGVTMASPFTVSGTLTLTAGKANTTNTNLLTVNGTDLAAISGGSATAYINGPLARTIASGNANTNYYHFPVGKAAYAPVWAAPATTAVTVMKAEAFDTNAGTMNASIINLPATRRWEVPIVSGTVTNVNVRLGSAGIVSTSIPVQAPAAAGAYTSTFGSVATFAAGTPNTTQSNNAVATANYTGFLSFADSNACAGTPAPGNTIASANNLCAGSSVIFSVQNSTSGSGVTYQWQSSSNGTDFTDIDAATATTYTTVPTAQLYYRLKVRCATGPAESTSAPVQILFQNAITASVPNARCGTGTTTLSATPGAGATVKWFDAATGGNVVGTGSPFTTPSISTTTTFYAVAQTVTTGAVTLGTGTTTTTDTEELTAFSNRRASLKFQMIYTAAELESAGLVAGPITSLSFNITSLGDSATNDDYTVKIGTTTNTAFANATYLSEASFTPVFGPVTYTHAVGVNTINFTTPFNWDGTSNIVVSVSHSGIDITNNAKTYYTDQTVNRTLYNYNDLVATTGTLSLKRFNVSFAGQIGCFSPRVPVVATVNPAPALTLSGNPAAICTGQSTAAVTLTAGASDYNTFTWTPSTGVTGNATTGWTFNPTATTTYTLNASQTAGAQCVANAATVTVTVNALPNPVTISPSPAPVCQGQSQLLTVNGAVAAGGAVLGAGTTAPSGTSHPNPFNAWFGGSKVQMLYRASELQAQGLVPGASIASLAFDFDASVANALNDMKIRIGSTTNTTTTAGFVPLNTLNPVYSGSYTPVAGTTGLVTFAFTTPYIWDGNNIIIEVVHNQGNSGNGAGTTTRTTTTSYDSVYYLQKDGVTPAGAASFDALTPDTWTAGGTYNAGVSTSRPNVVFNYNYSNTVAWAPATELYTDAAATVPYTGGNSTTVYTKPTAARTYTATITNVAGCSITATVDVSVNIVPAPSTPATSQDVCSAGTVANLIATGTGIKWYAAETGGTPLADTTVLVDAATYYASQTVDGCESVARTPLVVNIDIVPAPEVDAPTQVICNAGTVADLNATGTGILWYAAETGGTALAGDTALVDDTTYYASQTIDGCEGIARRALAVDINMVPAPEVDAPTQVICNAGTIADLNATGTGVLWYAAAEGGTALADDTVLTEGQIYYASQTIDGCEGMARRALIVDINVVAEPEVATSGTQDFCNTGAVADLEATGTGIQWYAAAEGGSALSPNDLLTDGTTYYASQTIDGCESPVRAPLVANITVVADIDGEGAQTITVDTAADATIEDIVIDTEEGATVTWYASEEDAIAGAPALAAGTQLTAGEDYFATQTVGNCTSAPFEVTVDVVLEKEDFDRNSFTYYPNPVKDVLNLSYAQDITSVSVFNLLGQQVISVQPNASEAKIDMSVLADGTYIVNVAAGNAVNTIKVVKKR